MSIIPFLTHYKKLKMLSTGSLEITDGLNEINIYLYNLTNSLNNLILPRFHGMEGIEEILTCKICMEKFNDSEKKPLFIPCGHTFCSKCLRFIYKKPSLKCPLDKKDHKFEAFSLIPTNFSLLNCVHSVLDPMLLSYKSGSHHLLRSEKKCDKHPSESLKFYCETHDALICQICLLESHLGGEG